MSGFRFSRRTVLAGIGLLEQLTQAKLSRYLLELGPQYLQWVGSESLSLTKRLNNLMSVLDQLPDRLTDDGELLRENIVEMAVSLVPALEPQFPWQDSPTLRPEEAAFVRALGLDGFVISGGTLRREMPVELSLPEAESELIQLLKKHGLGVPHGHLNQALDAHGRDDWAAANGQIRTFIDSLLDEIAVKIDPTSVTLKSGQARRAKLASLGFLSKELNEWDDHGLGFMNGLVKRLHPQGAHPGLSDESDSTFRLHIVLLTARLLLVRYDSGAGKRYAS
jgi:hypothetical protein